MAKRYFKIELNGYGGEFTMGRVNADFVEYWQDRDSDELVEHLNGLEWEDEDTMDTDSPDVCEDFYNVWEVDDIDHLNSAYADNGYHLVEVQLKDESAWNDEYQIVDDSHENEIEISDGEHHDFGFATGGRELFTCHPQAEGELDPVLVYHSGEKGNFGIAYVVTDGEDFDPRLVSISTVETDHGDFIESLWYGEQQLEICYDWADTNGKGIYAHVGYYNNTYADTGYDIGETLELIREEMAYLKEEETA